MEEFRTEIFGFNRQDVSRYIQKLSRSAKDYDSKNSERCTELEAELSNLNEVLDRVRSELKSALDQLSDKDKVIDEMKENLSKKDVELQRLACVYNELCTQISNAIKNSQEVILNDEQI